MACNKDMMKVVPPIVDIDTPLIIGQDTACAVCSDCKEGDGVTGPICLWKNKVIETKGLSYTDRPFIYKDLAIFTRNQDSNPHAVIVFYHKNTGKKLGEWEDYQVGAPSGLSNQSMYAANNTLVIGTGTRVYAIDLNTFKTKWFSKSHDWGDTEMEGIGSLFFHYTKNESQQTIYLEQGEVGSKKLKTIYEETAPDNIKISIDNYNTFVDQQDTILSFWVSKFDLITYESAWYISAYNVSQKKLMYHTKINQVAKNGGFPARPMIRNGKVYPSIGDGLYCFDIKTGKEIWKVQMPNFHTMEAIVGDDGNVYVSTFAQPESIFHCYDPNTGKELWNILVDTSLQFMVSQNNVVYSISSGTGNLHAIDVKQRKLLWRYACSESKGGKGIYFVTNLAVDKTNQKLYIGSNTSAYCFQTIK